MKRVFVFLAIMILPMSIWAMTPVTDYDLSNVTGQAGVNINPNISMNIYIGTMAWGDSDGITGIYNPWIVPANSSGGYIGIANFNLSNLTIEERMESTDNYGGYNTMMVKPITIDVATVNAPLSVTTIPSWGGAVTTENLASGTTFVRFGLGALEISVGSMSFDINLYKRTGPVAATDDINTASAQNLGDVEIGLFSMYINPWSYVDIYSASGNVAGNTSGVQFAVNVTIDKLDLTYIGWSDEDGLTSGVNATSGQTIGKVTATDWMNDKAAGYIGLTSLNVGSIAINGTVGIDINTTTKGIYAQLPMILSVIGTPISQSAFESALATDGFFQYNTAGTIVNGTALGTLMGQLGMATTANPVTVVHISFPTEFMIDVGGPVTAAVQLSNASNFAAGAGTTTLGDIYLSHFGFDIHAGSWVDIWAH